MQPAPENPLNQTPFEALGGEDRVRALTDIFYDRMDQDPVAAPIRRMHPEDLTESRQKLFEFLCGWLGGPQLFMQRRGHPRLRMRHMPFAIGESERDQWLSCMTFAMDQLDVQGELRTFLDARFAHVADFMRNQG